MLNKHLLALSRQKVSPDCKHLSCRARHESVNLSSILLNLSAVQHRLKSARLRRQLEQPLPLVFWERSLLRRGTRHVLGLALSLPRGDLLLLARQGALVVGEVVVFGVVRFNGFEEEITGFLEEGVDGKAEVIEVRGQRIGFGERVGGEDGERGGDLGLAGGRSSGQLVKEGRQEVRVVDLERKFDEDVLVAEVRLLESKLRQIQVSDIPRLLFALWRLTIRY